MARSLRDIIKNEKPEVVAEARKKSQEILLNIHLAEIRERVNKTQSQVAQAIGVKQPTIAGMEQEGQDIKLSTLKRYVESLGGKVNLDVELPDGTHFGFSL
ncbi:MAG: transcriptional regulator [Gammaproteobacteria bacterium]|nr:transcriptional regulator [Gammaproteobacteria bacterium]HBF07749.1 transcriptional regulator [Gammaproteobacteria bacterium]|tara:strand:+ start:8640 stop:8942 length:303 start_codon:yes stop_codon:yes gene_type:complete